MKDFKGAKGNWSIGSGGHCIVSTERPKRRGYSEHDYNVDVEMAGGYLVCESVPTEHDAKLIAAAPEMLQLLQEMDGFLRPLVKGEKSYIKTGGMYHERMKELLNKILNSCSQ